MSSKTKPKSKPKSKGSNLWLIAGAFLIMAGIAWVALRPHELPANQAKLAKPQVVTLSPARFQGKTREAYQAALDVPEILKEMPCYCGCMRNMGHKNNLDCFTDEHAIDCDLCQDIALDARDMYRAGKGLEEIRETIRARYSKYAS
jgi:hypothetical protein